MLALALAMPQAPVAQAPGQVPRVGMIRHLRPTEDAALAAFRQGLRELGYVEGQTLRLEVATRTSAANASRRRSPSSSAFRWMSSWSMGARASRRLRLSRPPSRL